jgi:hypothetical protein
VSVLRLLPPGTNRIATDILKRFPLAYGWTGADFEPTRIELDGSGDEE